MSFLYDLSLQLMGLFFSTLMVSLVALLYVWAERLALARSQQRDGVGANAMGGLQNIFADVLKIFSKDGRGQTFYFHLQFVVLLLVPSLAFGWVLQWLSPIDGGRGEVLLVLFLLFLTAALPLARILWNRDELSQKLIVEEHLFKIIAVMIFSWSLMPTLLRTGSGSLVAVSRLQDSFPFLFLLSSPGAFVCALLALSGIFCLLIPVSRQSGGFADGQSDSRMKFWADRYWTVALGALWVVVFAGGIPTGVVTFPLFLFKLMLVLALILWTQISVPMARATDVTTYLFAYVLPSGVIALALDLAWVWWQAW